MCTTLSKIPRVAEVRPVVAYVAEDVSIVVLGASARPHPPLPPPQLLHRGGHTWGAPPRPPPPPEVSVQEEELVAASRCSSQMEAMEEQVLFQ